MAKTGKHLFALPAELRNQIYQLVLVVNTPIVIDTDPTATLPHLLAVSSQIRQEARGIYYIENKFHLRVRDFNARAYLPWVQMAEPFWAKAPHNPMKWALTTSGPHWENLKAWLEIAHKDTRWAMIHTGGHSEIRILCGASDVVVALRDKPWSVVEAILPGIREMLASQDQGWMD